MSVCQIEFFFTNPILSRPRRLRKRALGRKVRKYFVKARKHDNLTYRIEVALQDFNAYVQERYSDLKDSLFCLRARIGIYAETKNTKKHNLKKISSIKVLASIGVFFKSKDTFINVEYRVTK